MAGRNPEDHRRKPSVTMYDPARDIYTVSDPAAIVDGSAKQHGAAGDAQTAESVAQSSVSEEQQPHTLVDGPDPMNPVVRLIDPVCRSWLVLFFPLHSR
jgi:hypothetical protein